MVFPWAALNEAVEAGSSGECSAAKSGGRVLDGVGDAP